MAIDGARGGNWLVRMNRPNEGEETNVRIEILNRRIVFRTSRDIARGQQLLVDYEGLDESLSSSEQENSQSDPDYVP